MIKPIQIKNFITKEECETIILMGENHELDYTKTSNPSTNEQYYDFSFNKKKSVFINSSDFIGDLTKKIIKTINELNILSGTKYSHIKYYQFNKYTENDFLNYHSDNAELKNGATITVVVELSENYDGGDFHYVIDNQELKFEKGLGSLYIFDSHTLHKVSEVKNGVRYSLNAWPSLILKNNKSLL